MILYCHKRALTVHAFGNRFSLAGVFENLRIVMETDTSCTRTTMSQNTKLVKGIKYRLLY